MAIIKSSDEEDLIRQFSVLAKGTCFLMCLKLEDLNVLEEDFPEEYSEIFLNSLPKFKKIALLKFST